MTEYDDQLLSENDVAQMYRVSRATVLRWLDAGRIPQPVKRRHRFTRWLKSQILEDIRRVDHAEKAEACK